jgi:opacity protein-like surface antigen
MDRANRRPRRLLAAVAALLAASSSAALAAPVPPVWVTGEEETPDFARCGLSYASALAAAAAAFRYNRVALASKDDWTDDRALRLYVNLNALQTGGSCAVAIHVQLDTATATTNPVTHRGQFATVVYAWEGSLLTGPASTLQNRVNADIRDAVEKCVATYERRSEE